MTPLPNNPERDPLLSAAWREHSAEMPPAQLDAAILAAAHRAVGSAPRDAGKQAAEATSPQRWWMPLAAAATIGAVALGILQTLPQQPPVTAPSVSDMPARPSERATALPSAPSDKLTATERKDAPRAMAESAVPQTPTPRVATGSTAPAKSAAKVAPSAAIDAASPPVPAAVAPQPFPAEKKSEAAESADLKDRARGAPTLAATPIVAQSAEPARGDMRRQNETAASAPAASRAVTMAKTVARADAPSAPAVDVDAWILRIRKLHDDGKLADAAKELVAMRAAIPDADGRLPMELRAWAATVKP
jgi:resuscitation-promoting factor RpfA